MTLKVMTSVILTHCCSSYWPTLFVSSKLRASQLVNFGRWQKYACMKHFHKLSCNYFQVVFMERCDYIYLCHENIYTAVHSVHEGVMDSCSNYLELLRIPIDYQVYYTTSGDKLYLQFVSFHLVSCVKKFCAKCCHGNFVILNINLEIYTEINATNYLSPTILFISCTLDPHSMALELPPWWLFCMKFSNCCTMLKHKMLNSSASARQED